MVQVHLGYNEEEKTAMKTEGETERDEHAASEDHQLLQHYCLLFMSTFKADKEATPVKTLIRKWVG